MQLGKSGITEAFLKEVEFRLKKQKVVKIRVLKSFRRVFNTSIEKIAEEVAEKTNSRVYEVRGFTFTLIKEN
ncbi:MAG: YhbY family RNA-binding protein [Desulfurococcaceae archaeon]|nr:YhbY family RNA-binding protein [Desulfurococcaceae archaeon]